MEKNFYVEGVHFQGIASLNSRFILDSSEPLMAVAVLNHEPIKNLPFEQKDGFKVVLVRPASITHIHNQKVYEEWCNLVSKHLQK